MSTRRLFIASTPMIALEAAGAALAHPGRARLVLIEDFDLAEQLCRLLRSWPDNPFESILRLPGRHVEQRLGSRRRGLSGLLQRVALKRRLRRRTLSRLRALDAAFVPDEVWVGNDRKVETQLALHLASTRARTAVGRYLDDGLYSYLGDVRQRPLVRRIDRLVKRTIYGRWWNYASQAGTTPWIVESWLAFPAQARDLDPARARQALPARWFATAAFRRLAVLAARQFGVRRETLRACSALLVLPHSNQLRADPATLPALRELIQQAAARQVRIALKYHPRDSAPDPGGLQRDGITQRLPALLPMELLLPLLRPDSLLLGEGSTALLAARWLRADLQVFDLGLSTAGYAARARALFATHGIESLGGDAQRIAGLLQTRAPGRPLESDLAGVSCTTAVRNGR